MPGDVVVDRIARRYEQQMADGFLDEVRRLGTGPPLSRTVAQALGYRELLAHLAGETDLDEALHLAVTRTRQLARRQRSWFRRYPRITWLAVDDDPLAALPELESRATALWGPP